jgi:hypothetical protein
MHGHMNVKVRTVLASVVLVCESVLLLQLRLSEMWTYLSCLLLLILF